MTNAIEYERLLEGHVSANYDAKVATLTNELPNLWKDAYLAMTPRQSDIYVIQYRSFHYIFDDYATLEVTGKVPYHPQHEARIVAAFGLSVVREAARDDYRLKGWVGATEKRFGKQYDKGHFIAHSIGGAVDQCELNVYPQKRTLNRGWSPEGKRFRAMESYCFKHPETFCFSRPIYMPEDGSAKPYKIEYGILMPDGCLWHEIFDNF